MRRRGFDIFRIIAALVVFFFHSAIWLGCSYGILDGFIGMGAVFMTGFFVLSGFTLFYRYQETDLTKIENMKRFYLRRFISIVPLYWLIAILYILILGTETWKENLLLFPVESLGIQSVFASLFSISHNGLTWFISCLLLCYLVFPFLQEILKQMKNRGRMILLLMSVIVLLVSPFVVSYFELVWTYANPFFRGLQFLSGMILCASCHSMESKGKMNGFVRWLVVAAGLIVLVVGISVGIKLGIGVGNYPLYDWIAMPVFMLLMIVLFGFQTSDNGVWKVVGYLSGISYEFYLAQIFVWPTTKWLMKLTDINTNLFKIVISLLLCFCYAVLLHELVQKPLSRVLRKKLQV